MEKEKRQKSSFPLTLAGDRKRAEGFILGALSARPSGNGPGTLPGQLPEKSPAVLPARASEIGRPMDIKEVARLIGCSPCTVRRKFLRAGLPHLRCTASSKLIFYEAQVVAWIAKRQKHQGGNKR
jgi:predicted DNA-binding transcriptional regulator AlpA